MFASLLLELCAVEYILLILVLNFQKKKVKFELLSSGLSIMQAVGAQLIQLWILFQKI